ncbi:MAG: alpha/beta hydrolase [Nocardioidaceae bacterium]
MDSATTLGYYDVGATPFYACAADQRFSYCLFVPEDYDERATDRYRLVVAVHGTNRPASEYRHQFAQFARDHHAIVLAPLFPVGIGRRGELHDYKFIESDGVRFDLVLLSMVDEVSEKYRIDADGLLLHGFSGGAHFAHRFYYLHPDRLAAVSIGAPGMVTLLDDSHPWWVGVRDLNERFGTPVALDALRDVAVQVVIGSEDTDTWEITLSAGDHRWMPGANDAGVNRLERITSLRNSLQHAGISVRHDVVKGVAHEGFALLPAVCEFFATVIDESDPEDRPTTRM